jgi:hypothetical protein
MIQPRSNSWSADQRISLADATDLQSLLELIVQRYQLLGGVIADSSGTVKAQTGGAVKDLQELATVIDVSVLPRYYANGPYDAYVDLVGNGMIALLMRERPAGMERSELGMVSDYAVAKEMTEELRIAIKKMGA